MMAGYEIVNIRFLNSIYLDLPILFNKIVGVTYLVPSFSASYPNDRCFTFSIFFIHVYRRVSVIFLFIYDSALCVTYFDPIFHIFLLIFAFSTMNSNISSTGAT